MATETFRHVTVLLDEAVELLVQNADGFYVDGTFGRGGHSSLILQHLSDQGRLMAIDKDLEAIACAGERFGDDGRFSIAHGSFSRLGEFVSEQNMSGQVDGVLLDLGVSSPQLDDPTRGFSFQHDGPLDMRMDSTKGMTAAQWLASASSNDITTVLKEYGEERFARRIANSIVEQREISPIESTKQLASLIDKAVPKKDKNKHPATRSFQAIRIFINRELEDLEKCLEQVLEVLAPGGRFVVISFHSLEDRIVKRFFRKHATICDLPPGIPVIPEGLKPKLRLIGKAIKPGKNEIENNVRSRSAVMRIAEMII